jgi:predicted nucleotidyltransferase
MNTQPNAYGLMERDMQTLTGIFQKYPEVSSVYLFGSRAKSTHKQGSDIDLAVVGKGGTDKVLRAIKADFEESSLPYNVDVASLATVEHQELKEHIGRVGVAIYEKV